MAEERLLWEDLTEGDVAVSSGSALTAMYMSVSLPRGTSLPQHSTTRKAPWSRQTARWARACARA